MYRVRGIKTLNFGDNYNILGKTGVIDASEANIHNPESIVYFTPDDESTYRYVCQIKYFEILDGKDDN